MSELELKQFWGKRIKVYCTDGGVVEGDASYFTSTADNEPDDASITLETRQGLVCVFLHEIEKIETIQ